MKKCFDMLVNRSTTYMKGSFLEHAFFHFPYEICSNGESDDDDDEEEQEALFWHRGYWPDGEPNVEEEDEEQAMLCQRKKLFDP